MQFQDTDNKQDTDCLNSNSRRKKNHNDWNVSRVDAQVAKAAGTGTTQIQNKFTVRDNCPMRQKLFERNDDKQGSVRDLVGKSSYHLGGTIDKFIQTYQKHPNFLRNELALTYKKILRDKVEEKMKVSI